MTTPKTFLVGRTVPCSTGLQGYLEHTGQMEFVDSISDYLKTQDGTNIGGWLVSLAAKLCYKSLVMGKNANLTKTRDIEDNIKGVIESKHGAVLEHFNLNFITTDCSRVFTHELVRHRVGTAYSQTSGRYCAIDDNSDIVLDDPCLDPIRFGMEVEFDGLKETINQWQNQLGLKGAEAAVNAYRQTRALDPTSDDRILVDLGFIKKEGEWQLPFKLKKQRTSALRRMAPNGQTNEIFWSMNIRSLRNVLCLRTSRHAEWEIRVVFNQVAEILQERWPLFLHGGKVEKVDGLNEWTGLEV